MPASLSEGGRVHISFCSSNAFGQVKNVLEQQFRGIVITGGEHPLPPVKAAVKSALNVGLVAGLALVWFGDTHLFPALRMRAPEWYTQLAQNKLYSSIGVYFAANFLGANMSKTGAFEVYYDGKLVWSKLATGRNPDLAGIVTALNSAMAAVTASDRKTEDTTAARLSPSE